jgi:hypothetical protein
MYGHKKDEWLPALLKEIDSDQLPAYYGGTMIDSDGDPRFTSKVNSKLLIVNTI